MSRASDMLKATRTRQIRSRYAKHYEDGNNFVIEALHLEQIQIIIKPNEAVDLLGDLIKYVSNCKQIEEDY